MPGSALGSNDPAHRRGHDSIDVSRGIRRVDAHPDLAVSRQAPDVCQPAGRNVAGLVSPARRGPNPQVHDDRVSAPGSARPRRSGPVARAVKVTARPRESALPRIMGKFLPCGSTRAMHRRSRHSYSGMEQHFVERNVLSGRRGADDAPGGTAGDRRVDHPGRSAVLPDSRRLRRRRHQDRAPGARRRHARARPPEERRAAVVERDQPQQADPRARSRPSGRRGGVPAAGRERRRASWRTSGQARWRSGAWARISCGRPTAAWCWSG